MERVNGLDQFYSRMTAGGKIELFVGKDGSPTSSYPHVHVVHHGNGDVEVVASRGPSDHPWRTRLANPGGGDVNSAVSQARSRL